MSKIFVRQRRQVGEGAGQPRFRVVASGGLDMRIYVAHMRRIELQQLAAAAGAEIVYLSPGEQQGEPGHRRGLGQGRHRSQDDGARPDHAQAMQDLD